MPPASAFSSDMAAAGPSERARVITGDVAVLQKSIEDVHASLRALQRAVSGIELKLSMQSAVVTGAQQTAVSEEGIVDKMFGPWSMAFVATVAVIRAGSGRPHFHDRLTDLGDEPRKAAAQSCSDAPQTPTIHQHNDQRFHHRRRRLFSSLRV